MIEENRVNPNETPQELPNDSAGRIANLEKWFQASKNRMQQQRSRWQLNERHYYGDTSFDGPKSGTHLKFNLPLAVIETELPIIADYMPTFDILPREKNDQTFADMMSRRKEDIERASKLRKANLACSKDSLIYSNGLTQVLPEIDEFGNMIRLNVTPVDIFTWFPSPGATGFNLFDGSCQYHIFATPMAVEEILRRYGKRVPGEGYLDEYRSFQSQDAQTNTENNFALVKEAYYYDPDEKTYPCGRLTIWAGTTLLLDEPLWEGYAPEPGEYKPGIPYFMIKNYGTDHRLFGIGETELVATQTKCLNETMSALADVIRKSGNPVRKVLKSWVNTFKRKILGVPGEDVEVNSMGDIAWEPPAPIAAQTFQFVELLMRLTDVITGVHDVTEGRKPAGITAAAAITALQEAAQARIRYKVTNEITEYIENIGKMIVWIIKTYDKQARTIRRVDNTGNAQFIKYDPNMEYDENGVSAGNVNFDQSTAKTLADSNFDISVVGGPRLPRGQAAREERALVLYEKGIYGIEQLVGTINEPDKQELIEDWYKRNGLEMLRMRQEEMTQAYEQFRKILADADQPTWIGSRQEEEAAIILQKYPDFLSTPDFQMLPSVLKERFLMGFLIMPGTTPAGDLAEQPPQQQALQAGA